ncbi:coiled-coil domain-containing protein 104 [Platysternon megacephalum]|uniref:Coiled-coil domain-containing protein 104 n=1 Tax=Platysternon megacephalum TaxID=55544 RepID=A0A4D9DYN8_9SAUR|nr:coiled-coil domain-containing protein 104 [Platysternon megacephalum]
MEWQRPQQAGSQNIPRETMAQPNSSEARHAQPLNPFRRNTVPLLTAQTPNVLPTPAAGWISMGLALRFSSLPSCPPMANTASLALRVRLALLPLIPFLNSNIRAPSSPLVIATEGAQGWPRHVFFFNPISTLHCSPWPGMRSQTGGPKSYPQPPAGTIIPSPSLGFTPTNACAGSPWPSLSRRCSAESLGKRSQQLSLLTRESLWGYRKGRISESQARTLSTLTLAHTAPNPH